MSFCKSGQILNFCHPNALMTLAEYLADYAEPDTKEKGVKFIERELERVPKENVKEIAKQNVRDIFEAGRRYFRF